jgi:hypothetical protein
MDEDAHLKALRELDALVKTKRMQEASPLAQANHFLIRNLIKYLVIEGPMEVDRMRIWLNATAESAEASDFPEAASVIRDLKDDLLKPKATK